MESFKEECIISFYEELYLINKSDKSEVKVVKNNLDNKIYVKKILNNYSKEVFLSMKKNCHHNISKIYEVIEIDKKLIIIEEFINGRTLEELLEGSTLTEEQLINYFNQICDALEYIHNVTKPIIHRDIKPSNIMVNEDGKIKIIDFDSSREFKKEGKEIDTVLLGTTGFASPEQYGFAQTDCRSDIYSLGVLLDFMLDKSDINKEVYQDIIRKCLNMNPDDRYLDIKSLRKDILKIHEKLEKNKVSWIPPGFRTKKIWKMVIAILGYIFIFDLCIVVYEPRDGTGIILIIQKIIFFCAMMNLLFLYSNYRGIFTRIPLIREKNIVLKLIGYILISMFILFSWILLEIIILSLI